jgi:hypothetical protein
MDLLMGLAAFCAKTVGMALGRQLTDEFQAWTPELTKWLLAQAVKQLPPDKRDRYEEEWQSHCSELPGQVARILHALSCFPAARSIRRPFSWPNVAKRALDIVFASAALILLAPLMACLALGIRLTSQGPVFQKRTLVGASGREFKGLYFRVSEYVRIGQRGEPSILRGHYRPTRIGRVIARLSLDALPLFFNILVGDMTTFR